MNNERDSPLGKPVAYADHYDPGLLFAIPRATGRAALGLDSGKALPFQGIDIWNAYEVSWLDARGKPGIAIAEFRIPAASPNLIESKSFKLYLNSYNQERLQGIEELQSRLAGDLGAACGSEVTIDLTLPRQFAQCASGELEGESLDDIPLDINDYGPPNRAHLVCSSDAPRVEECLTSHLFKSNCPVTGQPDWASIQIRYGGPRLDRAGLLRYLVSFRNHAEFQEQCVERIFLDVTDCCRPDRLAIHARYTRRGGLDINPWRTSHGSAMCNPRGARQ